MKTQQQVVGLFTTLTKGTVVITNSKLHHNNNTAKSGWNKGGSAIYNTASSKVTVENCEIYSNNALS